MRREGKGRRGKMKVGSKITAMQASKCDRPIYHGLQRQRDFPKPVKQYDMTNKTVTIHTYMD